MLPPIEYIRRGPLTSYFIFAFAISWGLILYAAWPNLPASRQQAEEQLPVAIAATVCGPSVAGIVVAFATDGTLTHYQNRFLKSFAWKWVPFLLLVAPLTVASILIILTRFVDSRYTPSIFTTPDPISLLGMGVGYGVVAGLFEELGWSGFAVPHMLSTGSSVQKTGLIVGLFWGMWHFLVALWGSGKDNGNFDFDLFVPWIPWNLLVLPAYRIIMVYFYKRTRSGLSMAIMHAVLTATLPIVFMPAFDRGIPLVEFYVLFALALALISSILNITDLRGDDTHLYSQVENVQENIRAGWRKVIAPLLSA